MFVCLLFVCTGQPVTQPACIVAQFGAACRYCADAAEKEAHLAGHPLEGCRHRPAKAALTAFARSESQVAPRLPGATRLLTFPAVHHGSFTAPSPCMALRAVAVPCESSRDIASMCKALQSQTCFLKNMFLFFVFYRNSTADSRDCAVKQP